MPTVSIIGAGNMGTAISRLAARSGAAVQLLAPDVGGRVLKAFNTRSLGR